MYMYIGVASQMSMSACLSHHYPIMTQCVRWNDPGILVCMYMYMYKLSKIWLNTTLSRVDIHDAIVNKLNEIPQVPQPCLQVSIKHYQCWIAVTAEHAPCMCVFNCTLVNSM